jgi:hypothetical protein
MMPDPQSDIENEIRDIVAKEHELATLERQLSQNEEFRSFMELKKSVDAQSVLFWGSVEQQMIQHDIKSIKGDWGSVTIAERLGWETTDELPSKFLKKVVDTKKLSDTYKLEGKAPKGTTPKITKYLMRRIK